MSTIKVLEPKTENQEQLQEKNKGFKVHSQLFYFL